MSRLTTSVSTLTTLIATCASAQIATAQAYHPTLTPHPSRADVIVREEFHQNGQIAKRFAEHNGKVEGIWQEWDQDGRARFVGMWRDGMGEGVWTYFHPNGVIRESSWVARDIWHGPSEGWHANGRLRFSGINANGAKLQPFGYWDEAGTWAGPLPTPPAHGAVRLFRDDWPAELMPWDFTFTPDLETMFFGTANADGSERRIMLRTWKDGLWSAPAPAPFAATGSSEGTPLVSPDGRYVYFSSDRHRNVEPDNPNRELYRASRRSGWAEVERVTRTPDYGEVTLSLACDGRGVLWTGQRPGGEARMGLYEVQLRAGKLEIAGSLNELHPGDPSNENFGMITPDSDAMIFANYAISGPTDEDLYLVRRTPTGWGLPVPLSGVVNTGATETNAHISADGLVLIYRSADADGPGYFAVSMANLGLDQLVRSAQLRSACDVPHD